MLKIDITSDVACGIFVSLAGKITADHLLELERLLGEARSSGRRIVLDLEEVTLADRDAVAFLALGPGRNAVLEGCPRFLREWIRRESEQEQPSQ